MYDFRWGALAASTTAIVHLILSALPYYNPTASEMVSLEIQFYSNRNSLSSNLETLCSNSGIYRTVRETGLKSIWDKRKYLLRFLFSGL